MAATRVQMAAIRNQLEFCHGYYDYDDQKTRIENAVKQVAPELVPDMRYIWSDLVFLDESAKKRVEEQRKQTAETTAELKSKLDEGLRKFQEDMRTRRPIDPPKFNAQLFRVTDEAVAKRKKRNIWRGVAVGMTVVGLLAIGAASSRQ